MKTEERERKLRMQLRYALARNPGAYVIIGAVAGILSERVKAISEGEKPTRPELVILESLARG